MAQPGGGHGPPKYLVFTCIGGHTVKARSLCKVSQTRAHTDNGLLQTRGPYRQGPLYRRCAISIDKGPQKTRGPYRQMAPSDKGLLQTYGEGASTDNGSYRQGADNFGWLCHCRKFVRMRLLRKWEVDVLCQCYGNCVFVIFFSLDFVNFMTHMV